jgi:CheY-like chemotaxis protein
MNTSKGIILWCDYEENIIIHATIFKNEGYTVVTFRDTLTCLNYVKTFSDQNKHCHQFIVTICSSMMIPPQMKPGCITGLEMIKEIRTYFQHLDPNKIPVTGIISRIANPNECKSQGINIVERSREIFQEQVIKSIKTSIFSQTEFVDRLRLTYQAIITQAADMTHSSEKL